MSGDLIKIKYDDRKIRRALKRLAAAGKDMTPAFRAISGVLADATEQAFQDEADPATGQKWDDLADVTKAAREKRGHWPGKILQESGTMAGSLVQEHGRDFASLTMPAEIEQGAIMQFGGQAGRGRFIPACAGNMILRLMPGLKMAVHPRVCGEH